MKYYLKYAVAFALAGAALAAACVLTQGPLPSDVRLTRALQAVFGDDPLWAALLTSTAKYPLVWLTLAVGAGMAWLRSGGRGIAATALTFFTVQIMDMILRALVYAPKPTPDLVEVASPSTASGFPSTFALVYGSIFGAVLLSRGRNGTVPNIMSAISLILLVVGVSARVVLGSHWMSQMISSLLLAFSFVILIHWAVQDWWKSDRMEVKQQ